MALALELELLEGPSLAHGRWPLAGPFTIGRAAGSALSLPDPRISREHALIQPAPGGWTLTDRHSRIGTHLNGLALPAGMPVALHPGDVLAIGDWRFRAAAARGSRGEVALARVDVGGRLGTLAEQRLELLLRCADEVSAAADAQALADRLAEHALAGSGYSRAAVLWRDGNGIALRSLRARGAGDPAAFRFDPALVRSATDGELVRLDPLPAASAAPARRALCAPLMLDGRAEAWLYVDADARRSADAADVPTFVKALARMAALALANLQRLEGERDRRVLAADIGRAREVQRRLLPGAQPVAGVRHALHLHPGRVVAGDIVDVFALPGGEVAALLGDVSGAGLGAGLVMASVQSFLRAELAHDGDPARAATRLDAYLCKQSSRGRLVTLWLGVFDPARRRCRFIDAGHGHAWRVRPGEGATPIVVTGDIPLGIEPQAHFHDEALRLREDEFVLLHSDGLTEQRGPAGQPFGRDALAKALAESETPEAAITDVVSALNRHAAGAPPDDDTTLLALGWSPR
jgi:serine phosphatase RsbU (regulator of sigma subunit)